MDRIKAPFAASVGRKKQESYGPEKVDCRDGRHMRSGLGGQSGDTIAATVGTSGQGNGGKREKGKDDTLPESMKDLTIKDIQALSEQKELVPDGKVIEGDIRGSNWVLETMLQTPRGCHTVKYTTSKMVGSGSFGVVFKAVCVETGQTVAIKRVLQDKRFKNRELQIMRIVHHPNIVRLQHCFTARDRSNDSYLHLVLEFIPDTVYRISRHYAKHGQSVPMLVVKLYIYQMCRSLVHIHKMGICHRDIKPQNLLVDMDSHTLKLCDFGSAKVLVKGEPNISYICSRYYRAPELIFGATEYTPAIDIWSTGCVMAELMIGSPMFPGDSGVDQLVEIIKVLGTPTREEINAMNPNYTEFKFPQIEAHHLSKVFKRIPANAVDLVSKFLVYSPTKRISALEALAHPFFDELRDPNTTLPDGRPLPPLFNWVPGELDQAPPELVEKIRGPN